MFEVYLTCSGMNVWWERYYLNILWTSCDYLYFQLRYLQNHDMDVWRRPEKILLSFNVKIVNSVEDFLNRGHASHSLWKKMRLSGRDIRMRRIWNGIKFLLNDGILCWIYNSDAERKVTRRLEQKKTFLCKAVVGTLVCDVYISFAFNFRACEENSGNQGKSKKD